MNQRADQMDRLIYTTKRLYVGRYAEKYQERTATHSNQLATEASKTLTERRLKRKHTTDLAKEIKYYSQTRRWYPTGVAIHMLFSN